MGSESYLNFVETYLHTGKMKRFSILNKSNEYLGRILFKPTWRNYVVEFIDQVHFDEKCLAEVLNFLKKLKEERKADAPK